VRSSTVKARMRSSVARQARRTLIAEARDAREAEADAVMNDCWKEIAEVEQREVLEPDDSLGAEHELPAVRQRLLGLFR
jgi:hypothetical protein